MRLVAAAAAVLSIGAHAADVVLHHRIFHPSVPDLPYLERAVISGNPPTIQPSPKFLANLDTFAEALTQLGEDAGDVLYQVALQHEGDSSSALWDLSSVKACHLSKASAETILLHVPSGSDSKPFAVDYFVSPIPHDGSCPQTKSDISPFKAFAGQIKTMNTTILYRSPEAPPLPELRTPPPLTPEGEVVKPVPEKSFLQKYWMYIAAFALVILIGGGPEDPEQPRRGGGGGSGGGQ
ncbi:hypothetical protein NLJ89_g150 [Agrocybe chaxingu]|uniref:ER membrane protein complex subunit 10 n=1 Tax=Agrocybe chaxingu TaxID=84603 RepID=A0A9W8TFB4_9AGAR|nr:hypothetical protein NLJ89_g150 [Agrocybe chaxingu]